MKTSFGGGGGGDAQGVRRRTMLPLGVDRETKRRNAKENEGTIVKQWLSQKYFEILGNMGKKKGRGVRKRENKKREQGLGAFSQGYTIADGTRTEGGISPLCCWNPEGQKKRAVNPFYLEGMGNLTLLKGTCISPDGGKVHGLRREPGGKKNSALWVNKSLEASLALGISFSPKLKGGKGVTKFPQ